MGTPTSWISLIIDPENLNQEFIRTKTENELFEIIIYLIYNGLNICSSQSNSFLANVDAKIEAEKFATIKFLLFKLLSHFQWNIKLILKNLPSIHQEFLFGEFKKFCFENATVPKEWSHFAEVLFHRWVIAFEQQSTYPGKNNFRRSTNSFNQNMQDPLYVSSEIQENSIKKIQNICPHSVEELRKLVNISKRKENNRIAKDISMPSFDSFVAEKNRKFSFRSKNDVIISKMDILDSVNYELGIWNYVHRSYVETFFHLGQIHRIDLYPHFLDYFNIVILLLFVPRNLKSFDLKLLGINFKEDIDSIIYNQENHYSFDDWPSSNRINKILSRKIKNFCWKNSDEAERLRIFSTYMLMKLDDLTSNSSQLFQKSIFSNDDKSDAQDNRVDDFVEEGEIDDEELVSEDDPELLMLQAIEPEMILQLIPSIERTAEMINPRWHSSKFDQFWTRIIAKSDVHKSSLILAKANELRNAHYFKESRVLYLSLLEDVQASNPLLAEMIRFEILHVDIEMFMAANQDICERNSNELRLRCQYFLRKIGPNSVNFIELIELVCFFLVLNTDISLSEFCIHHCETVRFSSLLKEFSIKSDQRDIFNKLLEFFIGFFLLPNTKFNQNFPKSIFTKSLVNFLCKIDSNLNIILIVSIFLIKFYSIIKDYTFPNVIFSSFQFDSFPIKMSVSLIDCLDKRYITAVLDEILNHYLKRFPENILLNRYFAEYLFAENCYHQALKYYVKVSMLETNCFAEVNRLESISILDQMIICCSKTGHHLQAAILFQFYTAPDYGLAFKELNEINQIDIADDLYECICDINLMEYIVYINAKRGEDERRSLAMDLISEPLFNQNNDATIMNEAAKIRKQKFLRILSRQYLLS